MYDHNVDRIIVAINEAYAKDKNELLENNNFSDPAHPENITSESTPLYDASNDYIDLSRASLSHYRGQVYTTFAAFSGVICAGLQYANTLLESPNTFISTTSVLTGVASAVMAAYGMPTLLRNKAKMNRIERDIKDNKNYPY